MTDSSSSSSHEIWFESLKQFATGVKKLRCGFSSKCSFLNNLSTQLSIYVRTIEAVINCEKDGKGLRGLPDFEDITKSIQWINQKLNRTIERVMGVNGQGDVRDDVVMAAMEKIDNDTEYNTHFRKIEKATNIVAEIVKPNWARRTELFGAEEEIFWVGTFGNKRSVDFGEFYLGVEKHLSETHGYYKLTGHINGKPLTDVALKETVKNSIRNVMGIEPHGKVTTDDYTKLIALFGPFEKLLEKACIVCSGYNGDLLDWFTTLETHDTTLFQNKKINFYIRYSANIKTFVLQKMADKNPIFNSLEGYTIKGGEGPHPNISRVLINEIDAIELNNDLKVWETIYLGLKSATEEDSTYGSLNKSSVTKEEKEDSKLFAMVNEGIEAIKAIKLKVDDVAEGVNRIEEKLEQITKIVGDIDQSVRDIGMELLKSMEGFFPCVFVIRPKEELKIDVGDGEISAFEHFEKRAGHMAKFKKFWKNTTKNQWTIFLLCEGYFITKEKSKMCHKIYGDRGYEISLPNEKFLKIAPKVVTAFKVLAAIMKIDGCGPGDAVSDFTDMVSGKLGMDSDSIADAIGKLETLKKSIGDLEVKEESDEHFSAGLLKLMKGKINENDIKSGIAGDLKFVQVPDDQFRRHKWLCTGCIEETEAREGQLSPDAINKFMKSMEEKKQLTPPEPTIQTSYDESKHSENLDSPSVSHRTNSADLISKLYPYRLEVEVISASSLWNADAKKWYTFGRNSKRDLSDPYVIVVPWVNGKPLAKQQTKVIFDDLNPEWRETFFWDVQDNSIVKINFTMYDDESTKNKPDDLMGYAQLILKNGQKVNFGEGIELEPGSDSKLKKTKQKKGTLGKLNVNARILENTSNDINS